MLQTGEILKAAESAGFYTVQSIDVKTLKPNPEVRKMCETNKCHQYGQNWTCPPACGTVEECRDKIKAYGHAVLLQTVGDIEDSFDFEAMEALEAKHKQQFTALVEDLRKTQPDLLPLNVGCCTSCTQCTYPDAPCRFPDKACASVEGYGLLVSDLCKENGVKYYYGTDKMAYTACILF